MVNWEKNWFCKNNDTCNEFVKKQRNFDSSARNVGSSKSSKTCG